MSKLLKYFFGLFCLAAGFGATFYLTKNSFGGEEFVSAKQLLNKPERDLATARNKVGIDAIGDHLLISTSATRAISRARLIKTDSVFQLHLGHFSTKNNRGEQVFACQVYNQITITYEAATSPKANPSQSSQLLFIDLPCRMAENDVRRISPINLSPANILKEPPGDGTFSFNENGEFSIRLQNIDEKWPLQWVFKSVQFRDSQSQMRPIEVTDADLAPLEGQRLNMDWSQIK